ncbi:MAG: hypothetical protein QG597_1233 [Actinomycetota bacterium]|nr:hypothetical protein [Actinomycetota bacterium]
MGYWYTEPGGTSLFAPLGVRNADGTDMRWGDGPADELCAGLTALIDRLRSETGRYPSVAEIDAQKRTAWEMRRALRAAAAAFRQDLGRPPSRWEIAAGLNFADAAIALEAAVTADLSPGDSVVLRTEGHQGVRAVVQSIDLGESDEGALEVLVAVRTEDGGELRLEPRHIEGNQQGPQ